MQQSLLSYINTCKKEGKHLLAILLDPDKIDVSEVASIVEKIEAVKADFIFVGGSYVKENSTNFLVKELATHTSKPIVLFPGDFSQLSHHAHAVLFLSLLSGQNPEYLINQQIKAVPFLKTSSLEILPTGYILIDGGTHSSVSRVSNTQPIPQENIEQIIHTALAGEYKGKKLVYLEAGSGATQCVHPSIIEKVSDATSIPIIVGGGITTKQQATNAFNAGATIVVVGNGFEANATLL